MKTVTVKEFAELVRLSEDAILRAIQSGKIEAVKENPLAKTSKYLIPKTELMKFIPASKGGDAYKKSV